MADRTITDDNLGAWLIKCDPESKFDLPAAIEDGLTEITGWSVVRGYRADMMKQGDKIILWVSGNGRRMERGIWGAGYVTDPVDEVNPEDDDATEIGYWIDQDARQAVELFVPVDIPLFEDPLTADDLLAAGIEDLEVQKMPGGANPSWVSMQQLARIEPLLSEWPEEFDYDEEEITVSDRGAGFGSPAKNSVVEAAAMAAVIEFYDGWKPRDVSQEKVGWDIIFTHKQTREVAKVEVKGVSGTSPIVLLTANEIRGAEEESGWLLAVVTRALSDPQVAEFTADEALAVAVPYVYRADLHSRELEHR